VHGSIYEFETLPTFGKIARPYRSGSSFRARRGRAVPLVGIIRNPRSHRNKGVQAELADCSNILTETPRSREDLYHTLAGFARRGIDYLVVDGGDGTVRDVLSCGADIFGDEWPMMIVLPKGKTNALAVDIGLPNRWSLTEALAAARAGNTVTRRPLRITSVDGNIRAASVQGFFFGNGVFSMATQAGQEVHRRGAFNSFAVGLAILWAVLQSLFGRANNPWRSCTPMQIVDRETGRSLPHPGPGDPARRFIAVATTFENFPLGARPFGRNPAPGLKMGVIDSPVRWVMALLPAILLGLKGRFLERNGAQRFCANELELELGGSFILDGEAFPAGRYILGEGPLITFVVP
jgi:Sphingosine kinase and enzymes related to eukaryotic diacylglycerol kinase